MQDTFLVAVLTLDSTVRLAVPLVLAALVLLPAVARAEYQGEVLP